MQSRVYVPSILFLFLVLLVPLPSEAGDTDLNQTKSDLASQTTDKERMDTFGSSKVELSEIRTWLNEAANAIQEEAEKKCRQIFNRIRTQLKLVDEKITLSKLDDEAKNLEQQIADLKRKSEQAKQQLSEKKAKLRALKMINK